MIGNATLYAMDKADLYYKEGSSDKEYHALISPKDGGYVVDFSYGRRGATLAFSTKTPTPVPLNKAREIFCKLVREKEAKGYSHGEAGTPYVATNKEERVTNILPQLLNPIEENDLEGLINSNDWVAQEKYDGRRILLQMDVTFEGGRGEPNQSLKGINRLGLTVGIPQSYEEALSEVVDSFVIDGEAIGNKFYAFDILSKNGNDLKGLSYVERLDILENLLSDLDDNETIIGIGTAYNSESKQAMVNRLRKDNAEGVVFKNLEAKYVAGRPASGGSQRKFKFWKTASCIVSKVNSKRSVKLSLLNLETKEMIEVGNVTIPVNYEIPNSGDIVEIRYLYMNPGEGCSLIQPTYLGKRNDISEDECTTDQIKTKNSF